MTIKNKFTVIKNDIVGADNHDKKTMALLKKLLIEKDMTQQDLARLLQRDKTTISRWSNDSREIHWDNAVAIAKILNVHPVEIYQPRSEIVLRWYVNSSYNVKMYDKEDQHKITIPFEYYNENVRAIQVNIPGSHVDGEVYLFDIPKVKKWSSLALNKYCYCTASKSFKKKVGKKHDVSDVIGILKANSDYTFSVMNPLTGEPVKPGCHKFTEDDLEIAVPVKVKFNPQLLQQKYTT
jgi:transcriptional regulator with XRE-family HTH domain